MLHRYKGLSSPSPSLQARWINPKLGWGYYFKTLNVMKNNKSTKFTAAAETRKKPPGNLL